MMLFPVNCNPLSTLKNMPSSDECVFLQGKRWCARLAGCVQKPSECKDRVAH